MKRRERPAKSSRRSPRRPSGLAAVARSTVFTLMLLFCTALGWLVYFASTSLEVPATARQFEVGAGSGFHAIARQLVVQGLLHEHLTFMVLGRVMGKAGAVKAGIYELPPTITPYKLIEKLSQGNVEQSIITLIEGWTFAEMRATLNASPFLRHDSAQLSDLDLLARLKIAQTNAEGLFFPDTYRFNTGASDLQILTLAHQTMTTRLQSAWEHRAAGLPFDKPYDALILASIVEKETGRPEDRKMVAAVFVNRLKRGMLLQTDPSVIYGMGKAFDGNLRKRDLQADQLYNTYTRVGLPPTPIALPGQASLEAALDPAQSNALYFVSRGDGTSYFSDNLEEHNRAVQKYQLKR